MEKEISGRLILKHDLEENWLKAVNFIPKQGEIIIYDVDNSHNYERLKIGNGIDVVSDLPFTEDVVKEELGNVAFIDELDNENIENGTPSSGNINLDSYIFITLEDIDAICGQVIEIANDSGVTF